MHVPVTANTLTQVINYRLRAKGLVLRGGLGGGARAPRRFFLVPGSLFLVNAPLTLMFQQEQGGCQADGQCRQWLLETRTFDVSHQRVCVRANCGPSRRDALTDDGKIGARNRIGARSRVEVWSPVASRINAAARPKMAPGSSNQGISSPTEEISTATGGNLDCHNRLCSLKAPLPCHGSFAGRTGAVCAKHISCTGNKACELLSTQGRAGLSSPTSPPPLPPPSPSPPSSECRH